MKEEPPAKSKHRRLRHPGWWLLAFLLAGCGYAAWREYDYRAAVREAKEAKFEWESKDPISLIRQDWRAALKKETWATHERHLEINRFSDGGDHHLLLQRLRPTWVTVVECENVESLKGLASLRVLDLIRCSALKTLDVRKDFPNLQEFLISDYPELQNLDILKGLTSLQSLRIWGCPALHDLDALKTLTELRDLTFWECSALQNLEPLKTLTHLRKLTLFECPALQSSDVLKSLAGLDVLEIDESLNFSDSAIVELNAALPNTQVSVFSPPSIPQVSSPVNGN